MLDRTTLPSPQNHHSAGSVRVVHQSVRPARHAVRLGQCVARWRIGAWHAATTASHSRSPWLALRRIATSNRTFTVVALLLLSGCNGFSGGDLSGDSNSLFGNSTIPTRAVVVTAGQRPYPLESLPIYGSPASDVNRALAPIVARHLEEEKRLQADIEAGRNTLNEARELLASKESEVIEEYNTMVPKASENPSVRDRSALAAVSKLRAQKTKADEWYRGAVSERIEPVKSLVSMRERELTSLERQLAGLQSSFVEKVFRGLPAAPRKTWTTNTNGEVGLTVPNGEPWVVWASTSRQVMRGMTERYRWIRHVPKDLDSNGALFLDHNNLLELQGLVATDFVNRSSDAEGVQRMPTSP
jgi:hypothetical protein